MQINCKIFGNTVYRLYICVVVSNELRKNKDNIQMEASTLQLLAKSLPPEAVKIIAKRLRCAKSTVYYNLSSAAKNPKKKIIDAAIQYLKEIQEAEAKQAEEIRRVAS